MGKGVITPLYISVAWTLVISYQLFTQTAVETVVTSIRTCWPSAISAWLYARVDTIVFIHAFAWIFVLSSVIPSVLLRKQGSVLIQFLVCLTLALVSIWVKDNLPSITESQLIDQIFTAAGLFNNPMFAGLFLLAPYFLMLSLDIHSRTRDRKKEDMAQELDLASSEDATADLC